MAVRDVSVLKDKETGDISVLHDKNLQDAKAKTTPDNTDAVRMVDVNGKEVYIQRDSFAAAVFSVINSNNKDSVAGLFGVDASGGFGKITASNLASVLSAAGMVNAGNQYNPVAISSLGCGVFTGVNAMRDFSELPSELGQAGVMVIRAKRGSQNDTYSTIAICTEDNKGVWARFTDSAPWIKQ